MSTPLFHLHDCLLYLSLKGEHPDVGDYTRHLSPVHFCSGSQDKATFLSYQKRRETSESLCSSVTPVTFSMVYIQFATEESLHVVIQSVHPILCSWVYLMIQDYNQFLMSSQY